MTVPKRPITVIVARARNGVIGMGNQMPWHLPEELTHFKNTTMGHALILGRKTFDSIGRALPGRQMIVVTRDANWQHEHCHRANSFAHAIEQVEPQRETFVAGGAQLYAIALPLATRLLITEIDLEPTGDVFFPDPDPTHWRRVDSQAHQSSAGVGYRIDDWARKKHPETKRETPG